MFWNSRAYECHSPAVPGHFSPAPSGQLPHHHHHSQWAHTLRLHPPQLCAQRSPAFRLAPTRSCYLSTLPVDHPPSRTYLPASSQWPPRNVPWGHRPLCLIQQIPPSPSREHDAFCHNLSVCLSPLNLGDRSFSLYVHKGPAPWRLKGSMWTRCPLEFSFPLHNYSLRYSICPGLPYCRRSAQLCFQICPTLTVDKGQQLACQCWLRPWLKGLVCGWGLGEEYVRAHQTVYGGLF